VIALPADDSPDASPVAGPAADGGTEEGTSDRAASTDVEDSTVDGAIHFHFPIDIHVVGGNDDELADQVVERVFEELRRELERRA
jgi:hypothetical protein